jgi:hypothetical protein
MALSCSRSGFVRVMRYRLAIPSDYRKQSLYSIRNIERYRILAGRRTFLSRWNAG